MNLLLLPLPRFCSAIHSWMLQHIESNRADEFEYHLTKPPPGRMSQDASTVRDEMDAFAALAMTTGGAR